MRDAGWLNKSFDRLDRVMYTSTHSNSIKVPYFANDERKGIARWKSRLMNQTDPSVKGKYRASGSNRAIDLELAPNHQAYNSELLASAKGKTVLFTEREFKSLVTTEKTGLLTIGLPGIQ
jgi:hypothetical protein